MLDPFIASDPEHVFIGIDPNTIQRVVASSLILSMKHLVASGFIGSTIHHMTSTTFYFYTDDKKILFKKHTKKNYFETLKEKRWLDFYLK